MAKKFNPNGALIKRRRTELEAGSLQKEFAVRAGTSERKLRQIENGNDPITASEAERIAKLLGLTANEILFGGTEPRLVPAQLSPPTPSVASEPAMIRVPRFEEEFLRVVRDEAVLLEDANRCHRIVVHVLAQLNGETTPYITEMVGLLQSLSWTERDRWEPLDAATMLGIRKRLRELYVLLKGNDIWIYELHHTKHLPESYEVRRRPGPDYEWQTVLAFGPPADPDENHVRVQVDNGQPWEFPDVIPSFARQ